MYDIYSITDPRDGSCIYIGQTKNFEQRVNSHLSYCHIPEMRDRINSIKEIGLKPLFSILESCIPSHADYLESKWIKHFSDLGFSLYNRAQGRPTIEKDPKRKQMNVMVSGITQDNEKFKERVKYMSFSAYVNSLIDTDLCL